MTAVALVLSGLTSASYAATAPEGGPEQVDPEADLRIEPPEAAALATSVPPSERTDVLGAGWESSTDRVWTLTGDASGLHVMTARVADGLEWRAVTTLRQDGFDTDRWVGNACLTGSGDRLVVAYAPRGFTNDPEVFRQGAFTAVVDLDDGDVTELPLRGSLEYFTPTCGHGEDAVVTVSGGDEIAATRLVAVDAGAAEVEAPVEAPGQLTSAVLTDAGLVAAVGLTVARIEPTGQVVPLVRTTSVPYGLTTDAAGGLVFLDHDGTTATARRLDARRLTVSRITIAAPALASGPLQSLGVTRTRAGEVVLTGSPRRLAALPAHVSLSAAPRGAEVSAEGSVMVHLGSLPTSAVALDGWVDATAPLTGLTSTVVNRASGATATVDAVVQAEPQSDDAEPAVPEGATEPLDPPAGPEETDTGASTAEATTSAKGATPSAARLTAAAAGDATNPLDDDRSCAVARNSVHAQALQPKPRQVEWAVNQAVKGALNVTRPAGWKNLGMAAYKPQTMFPPIPLAGGGEVPSQIMLGILAQESNLWQAPGYVVPGVTGSPLIGNYYGVDRQGDENDQWDPNFIAADCGYGVAQVTDGMRRGDTGMSGGRSLAEQRAIALDFAANVSAGLRILQDKWNQTRGGGLTINDGDPARIENWFFAVWAYNSGYYPESAKNTEGRNGAWGVGWSNNPANPSYAPFRSFFHADPYDATHPQDWPYPEKVIGFAAYPPALLESPDTFVAAYRAAWWPGVDDSSKPNSATRHRAGAKPPVDLFCNVSNHCNPAMASTGSSLLMCSHRDADGQPDYRCWYNGNATWKTDCPNQCGRPFIRFPLGYAYQDDGAAYPPVCSDAPLPANALIVDDVPRTAPVVRPGCARTSDDAGTFTLTFSTGDDPTEYPSKMDLHQLGAGYGGHFWFGHTRQRDLRGGEMEFTGTWRLAQPLRQWTRIMVHIPDHGAHTRQAEYVIDPGLGRTQRRTLLQRTQRNGWVSLGVFEIDGVPAVSLSTNTEDGDYLYRDGERLPAKNEDIAFDAVAFVPLDAKPRDFVVALGDSYSSGEGAGTYYAETDTSKSNPRLQNGCHRSPLTWSRMGTLPASTAPIGQRADSLDPTLDYHLLACSGAFIQNVRDRNGSQRFGERTQIDRGFLDENTTLVTMSIGGNDAEFQGVIVSCAILSECHSHQADDGTTYAQRIERRINDIVGPEVTDLLDEIHGEAPNAQVLLMGYPKLFSGRCEVITTLTLSESEVAWMNYLAGVLADRLGRAAADANAQAGSNYVTFTDPRPAFEGKGICGSPENIHAGVLTPTDGDMLAIGSQQSFHPKAEGYLDFAWAMNLTLNPPVP